MTFYKKSDAILKLSKSNDPNLYLIQKDYNENGSKNFHIMKLDKLYQKIIRNRSEKKESYYYESLLDKSNIKFALDIDVLDDIDNIAFDKILITNINKVVKYAKIFYNYNYEIDNIIILKTKKQNPKQSAHVIFRGLKFQNYNVCKNFFVRILKQDKLDYCDPLIYGKTCLRTCFSSKKGKEFPLLPYKLKINDKMTCCINDFLDEYEYFQNTLITYIGELETKMITEEMIEKEQNIQKYEENEVDKNIDIGKILECLDKAYCDEYTKWNKVGMALYSISENNFNIFDKWSKKSKKYNYDNNLKIWNGYYSIDKSKLGIGSLIQWSTQNNFKKSSKNLTEIIESYPENKIKITDNKRYDMINISKAKLSKEIFVPNINKKILAIQSEKGTGKTSNLIKAIFETGEVPKSILFVSSRRTFGIKLLADLKKYDFKLYSDIEDQYIYDKRVIIQIDSLLRLQLDIFDLIIIDECESLARYITSNHFTKNLKSSTIVSNLEFRIFDSKKIIIMDADLSDRCLNYYCKIKDPENKLTKDDIKVIINTYTPYQDYTLNYMDYNSWLNEVKIKLMNNKKLAIPMASNNKAKDLYTKLKNDFPNKKIFLIHKETSDEEKLSELIKVNSTWVKYDVVIYTPTVCMGVSFDPIHFDNIFAYGCHNSLGAQEFCQMLHRVRTPKDKNMYISFDYYKFFEKNDDIINYEQSEEILCNDYYLTNFNLDTNLIVKKFKRVNNERVLYYPYKEEPIYDLYVRNCMEAINNKLNFTASFFGYIKFKKYKHKFVTSDTNDNLINELKDIRKTREDNEKKYEIESIIESKTLSKEEYKDKCIRSDRYMNEKDLFEIKKYNLMKNYELKEEELTYELLEEYNNKTYIMNYNNLATILNTESQTTEEKIELMKKNHLMGQEFRTCYQDFTLKNRYMYHNYSIILLKYCGFNINNLDNKEEVILKEFIEDSMNSKINDMTLVEYIESERYGIYKKFDCKNLIKKEIIGSFVFLLNIVNMVINKQYGLKIKILTKGKNKSYYLSSNNMWENLPNKLVPKEVIEKKKKDINCDEITNNLDNGLFIDIDSDDE